MKTSCPACAKSYQHAKMTYIIKNGIRVFPRENKCFDVLKCDCDVVTVVKDMNMFIKTNKLIGTKRL